jgi:hypothetical protein
MAGMGTIVPPGGGGAGDRPGLPGRDLVLEGCMSPHAVPVTLTAAERKTLNKRVRGMITPWRDRLRARIVLAAARGRDNARIAADLEVSVNTVRKWRGRFAACGLGGLKDLPGPGGRGGSARRIVPRWSRWPASCRRRPGCRCHGGPDRSWLPS